jgi:hypothetical protein
MTVPGESCLLLHGFAAAAAPVLLAAVRRMATPSGPMSVPMTSYGAVD